MFRVVMLACLASVVTAADLASLSWLAGRWTGGVASVSEEIWSPPAGDTMMGMWRMVAGGKTRIFEFMTLKREGEAVVLLLRHFDPALGVRASEREGPVRFRLVTAGEKWVFEATEDGAPITLTYSRPAPDKLTVVLTKSGKPQTFSFDRAKD